jgi:hypothetical protein
MVMCSDFSLKALINEWSEQHLGPNPFVEIGECKGLVRLHFNPEVLAGCSSAQLRKVGELCEEGAVDVMAMQGTIVYGVDRTKADTTV